MLNTHIAPAWSRGLPTETPTFSRELNEGGYMLDYVGKWHVNEDCGPLQYGFHRHETPKVFRNSVPGTEVFVDFPRGQQLISSVLDGPPERHASWSFTTRGIDFIKERSVENNPFFLRVDLTSPHFANFVPEPYASMYDPATIPPWPNFDESFDGKPNSHRRKHAEWHLEDKEWEWWQPVIAKYYGDVSLLDVCVGRVLDEIDRAGIADNTVFMFSTDHGDAMGSHKHFEKAGTMYDEVFRVPLIIRAPGVQAGRSDEFVRLMDLMPTILEFAGIESPNGIDGMSLSPLLAGGVPDDWPQSVYCEHHGEVWGYQTQRSVRTREWKYVYNPTDIDELYDLVLDPYEMRNLSNDETASAAANDLKARLIGWSDATGDMFRWNWVRWNFPEPILPAPYASGRLRAKYRGN